MAGLNEHDVLLLNREIVKSAANSWTDDLIKSRTQELAQIVTEIWPVPNGHRSAFASKQPRVRKKIGIPDLLAAGALTPGMSLFPRRKKHSERVVVVLPDGRVEVDGVAFARLREAATSIVGKPSNGWWFFLVDQEAKRSLRDVRQDYVSAMSVDEEDDEPDDDGDDDEDNSPG